MAFVALLDQHGADLLFEERNAGRILGADERGGGKQRETGAEEQGAHARTCLMT